jgi:hypothetical protein
MFNPFCRPLFVQPNNICGTSVKCKSLVIKSARDTHYKSSLKSITWLINASYLNFPASQRIHISSPSKNPPLSEEIPLLGAQKKLGYKIGNGYWAYLKPIGRLHLLWGLI